MKLAIDEITARDQAVNQALGQQIDPLKNTQRCLDFANLLIRYGKDNSELLLGLTFIADSGMSVAGRTASLLAFVGLQQQFNDHYLQHLVASAYATGIFATLPSNTRLIHVKAWKEKQLHLFLDAAQLVRIHTAKTVVRYLNSPALKHNQRWMVLVLSLLQAKPEGFQQGLKTVFPYLPYEMRQPMQRFLRYPGQFLPGMTVAKEETNYLFVRRTSMKNALIWNEEKQTAQEVSVTTLLPVAPSLISIQQWIRLLENTGQRGAHSPTLLPVSYPISRLPEDLKTIIGQLQDENVNLNKLVKNIGSTPLFANYLKETASTDNRMQLPVSDVKQAILTYGLTRVADMLVLRTLTNRLQQKYFPLLSYCIRVNTLCSSIAAQLAVISPVIQLAPQSAALLGSFYASPLFTLPALKVLKRWPKSQGPLYSVNSFVKSKKPLHELAIALLRQWQQPAHYQSIVAHSIHPIRAVPRALQNESAVLGLSLLLARRWLSPHAPNEDTCQYQIQAQQQLFIENQHIKHIQHTLSEHIWSPLPH
ncbi:hypothetical protein [Alteromonas sp. 14N.309.X.WAT.G.H12]|uniref:hypothetical protein n=1 Tax=Alteromonas sp. 14N.309.X.WAT.G.H12 TaxID=3120824 RepID=UPI002FD55391